MGAAAAPPHVGSGAAAPHAGTHHGAHAGAHASAHPGAAIASGPGDATTKTDGAAARLAEEEEEALPPPPSLADRLRGVPLVLSSLSERMLGRLRAAGVDAAMPKKAASGPSPLAEIGAPAGPPGGGSPARAARVRARCARLGLESLAPPGPADGAAGPPRLPASCSLGFAQSAGLWDAFRQRCGHPLPAEAPPIPCQLRSSSGGGQVVAPLLSPLGI